MLLLLLLGLLASVSVFFRCFGVIMRPKLIPLGSLYTQELTILEYKPLFSLKLFYFQPGTAQEVYHTHSFTAYSLLLYGNYWERFIDPHTGLQHELPRNRSRVIRIARNRFHQITKSQGCLTLMLTGPWGDTYKEYYEKEHRIVISTHGRKKVNEYVLADNRPV